MQENPEQNALRRYQDFPGLNQDSLEIFRSKRIALIGDSTLFYFTKWLQVLLFQSNNLRREEQPPPAQLDQLNLTHGQITVRELAAQACEQPGQYCIDPRGYARPEILPIGNDGTMVGWMGLSSVDDHWRTEKILQSVWETIDESYHPDIMIANQGIHWLHFYGFARNTSAEAIRRWIHYEDWLREVFDHAIANNVSVLLYKTTNFICEEKIYTRYQEANGLYQAQDSITIQRCQQLVQSELESHADYHNASMIAAYDIADYCFNGTSNNHGTTHLNRRLSAFVEKLLLEHPNTNNHSMHVGIYNDHDIESCEYCGADDGLHYHRLNLMRIRLLANQLTCVYPDQKIHDV